DITDIPGTVVSASFPAAAPAPITAAQVIVKYTTVLAQNCDNCSPSAQDGLCTGNAVNPTAPPGFVCVYPFIVSGTLNDLRSIALGPILSADQTGSGTLGFSLAIEDASDNHSGSLVQATWAYTAP